MSTTSVLLVDDDEFFADMLARRLSDRKLRIFRSFSGEEAFGRLEENPCIRIVVLDIKVPGLNGLETLAMIKNNFPRVEVILLTDHASLDFTIRGMKIGAYDFLAKPCDIEQVISKVEELAWRMKKERMK